MKKTPFFILISLCFSSMAQEPEKDRDFLLTNYISDIGVCSYCNKESYLQGVDIFFRTTTIVASSKYKMKRKRMGTKCVFLILLSIIYNFIKFKGRLCRQSICLSSCWWYFQKHRCLDKIGWMEREWYEISLFNVQKEWNERQRFQADGSIVEFHWYHCLRGSNWQDSWWSNKE